ncbi:uncharacterized protein LOC117175884 [Belonocnema kinseyi]|uniref:uncharacterized protein LOC117175884 n=1 Tax=Belonocnema kinseyi TaxID=2817044 RepID=UPI00143DF341|nr:uncharacterized protein LOC117175884 [Belonocnema kinseyi]
MNPNKGPGTPLSGDGVEPILGATIKTDEVTGKIVIARIMHGGAADRSGLIHVGDEVCEVNGISVEGKTPNCVLKILQNSEGTITFKIVPADSKGGIRESKVRVRAHFSYKASDDPHTPCKEAGLDFSKGDVLHIVSQDDIYWWQARREGDRNMRAGLIPSRALQERRIIVERQQKEKVDEDTIKNDDFDREEIPTYEEVAKLYPRPGLYRPVVLIGPPGVGRNELKRRVMASDPEKYKTPVPYTSRPPRPGEINGKEYHFVSREKMEEDIEAGKFIEYGEYKGNLYGTNAESVSSLVDAGYICILNPHYQALKMLRTPKLKPYVIYIKPPRFEVLKETRNEARARSTFDEANSRGFTDEEFNEILHSAARIEFIYSHLFDEVIVNADLSMAFEQLVNAIQRVESEALWVPASWKMRRNKMDYEDCGEIKTIRSLSGQSIVNNYSIVASRGELARDHFCESTRKNKTLLNDGKMLSGETRRQSPVQGRRGSRDTKAASMKKSVSVPANLKGLSGREKTVEESELPEEQILSRSSSFLGNLPALPALPDRNRHLIDARAAVTLRPAKEKAKAQNTNGFREDETRLSSALKRYSLSFSNRKITFGSKPLSKNSTDSAKKSVSFSSDTGIQEKKSFRFRKTAIHEAKVYKKGVLRDPSTNEECGKAGSKLWEAPLGGPFALLRVAREADDEALEKIITRIAKFGMGDIDVNLKDSSGRTATSYLAGNGSTSILEAALSFTGIDPNIPDNEGNTPLHFAAQAGQTECLNILLQRCIGIEVNIRNNFGFTPLMKAALQGRTKCAKILLFAGANPTLRDHGRGFRADQWAKFCGRYVCAEVIERFARHRLLEKTNTCRWGSEPELAAKVFTGRVIPFQMNPHPSSMGLRSRLKRVFRTSSGPDRTFSLVSQLTSAALCVSSAALPTPEDVPPIVKNLLRPLNVPQLRITLVQDRSNKCSTNFSEKIESTIAKKKSK